jgi:phosphatidylserine decarboxylase
MSFNDTSIIAKDGFKCIAAAAALLLVCMAVDADILTFLSALLLLLTLWVFRNPERSIPYFESDSIVSVADGMVKSIETLEDTSGVNTFKIVIKSGFLDTSVLRVPFSCEVGKTETVHGARLSPTLPLSDKLNEQSKIVFGQNNKQVRVMHKLHMATVGIKNRLTEKAQAVQGMRYGLMVKGETTMILPGNSRVAVKVGEKVRAGETLIGYFS